MKAVVVFSGGLDSTVMLAQALSEGRECLCLTFDYKQRHRVEIAAACEIAQHYGVNQRIIQLDPKCFDNSSLVQKTNVPKNRSLEQIQTDGIPCTYVPARNTLFLAYAAAQAEIWDAHEIYFGANAMDQPNYPDTRPEYLAAFQGLLNVATKQAIEGHAPTLRFPYLKLNKRDIIRHGMSLKAPLQLTLSCYDPPSPGHHCGRCDACYLRKEGFIASGSPDPTTYLDKGLPLEAVGLQDMV